MNAGLCSFVISLCLFQVELSRPPLGTFIFFPVRNRRYADGILDQYGRVLPYLSLSDDINESDAARLGHSTNLMPMYSQRVPQEKRNEEKLYEYIAGRLVPGTFNFTSDGKRRWKGFLPDREGKIITLSQYMKGNDFTRYGSGAHIYAHFANDNKHNDSGGRPIYNLPGYFDFSNVFVHHTTFEYKPPAVFDKLPFPRQPTKVVSTSDTANKYVKAHFVLDEHLNTSAIIGKRLYTGYIQPQSGSFVIDDILKPVSNDVTKGLPRPFLVSNEIDEPVYEFRYRRLIPGFIHTVSPGDMLFVPDVDGKIIDLEEYLTNYDPKTSRRIYNLPGKIVLDDAPKK